MTLDDNNEEQFDSADDLIRYLEHEKDRLKKCVEQAAAEWEFTEAKACAKAYRAVVGRLDLLKNLKDPRFDERAALYRRLIFLEEKVQGYRDPEVVKHFTKELKQTNDALDAIEKTRASFIETQYIDDALFQLVEGSIESFKLHLNKDEQMTLDFVCNDQQLQIGLSYKKRKLFSYMKKKLRQIGFVKIDGQRRFVRHSDVSNFKDAQKIKQLLSVIVFDVFGRSWFDNPASLEIVYKSGAPPDENTLNQDGL